MSPDGRVSRKGITKLSRHVRSHERAVDKLGARKKIVRAVFDSPGFVTVDGSGALEKLIEILHSGDIQKEERRAIIERIHAETDLLKSQATQKRIEALSAAVAILKSLGISDDQIVKSLGVDRGLVPLLGGPLVDLEDATAVGSLQRVEIVRE